MFDLLYEEPQTASDIAKSLDMSVQNAKYHLDKLEEAGLIEIIDIWYSDRGREMNVYAPTSSSIIYYLPAIRTRSGLCARFSNNHLESLASLVLRVSSLVGYLVTLGQKQSLIRIRIPQILSWL